MTGLAGIVLAAGAGTRLVPLTELVPKALCPVANRPLLDHALERLAAHTEELAVNVHHHRDQMLEHLEGRSGDRPVHVSVEEHEALGTAGGVAKLADWLDGRDVLVANADAWGTDRLDRLVTGWDHRAVRLLVSRATAAPDFEGMWRFAGVSLMPWSDVEALAVEPSGLYEALWRRAQAEGRIELVPSLGVSIDCGTPRDYLAANLVASGGGSVIGAGAEVMGRVERSVVWPGARVAADEHLRYAIRLPDGRTVRTAEEAAGSETSPP